MIQVICSTCGTHINRIQISKSSKYFCSKQCKSIKQGHSQLYSIPTDHPVFMAVTNVYQLSRHPEYLVSLCIHKTTKDYVHIFGDFRIISIARVNNKPNFSKTPSDAKAIRDCFANVTMQDLNQLITICEDDVYPGEWRQILIKYWNPDITFEVE